MQLIVFEKVTIYFDIDNSLNIIFVTVKMPYWLSSQGQILGAEISHAHWPVYPKEHAPGFNCVVVVILRILIALRWSIYP